MHRFAPVALATILAATAPALLCAQAPTPFTVPPATGHFTDPANLAGERVRPRDGRELPIDGGLGANGQPDNALGLQQLLRKLNTRASLMLIVAHPDDEDGGMLTYYSRGLGARVAVLTLTRGEGGQNAMTGDFEDALGLIRTQELLSADRYMSVDQFFGTEVDFGFSKTKSESFRKWNHERVLYDAVRAVRIFRPLVIAAVFSGAVTDGHGQHQVSGEIAQEVFKAAGDPNVFPELTREGILPWQPLKVYARVPFSRVTDKGLYDYATGQTVPAQFTNYVTGQTFTTEPTADVTIHEGQTDPLLTYAAANLTDLRSKPTNLNEQLSYVQFARIGLGLQRTQIGPGVRIPPPGRFDVGYHLYGSRVCAPNLPNPTPNLCTSQASNKNSVILSEGSQPRAAVEGPRVSSPNENSSTLFNAALVNQPTFFDGIDTSVLSIADLAPDAFPTDMMSYIARGIRAATEEFDPAHPEKAAPALAASLKLMDELIPEVAKGKGDPIARSNALHELRIKRAQLNDALALALGLSLDATTSSSDIVAKSTPSVHLLASTSSGERVPYFSEELDSATGTLTRGPLSDGEPAITRSRSWTSDISPTPQLTKTETRPYFFRDNIEHPVYELSNPALRNAPATPPALTAWVNLTSQGVDLQIGRVVHSGPQPVQIVPAASLAVEPYAQVLSDSDISARFQTELHPTTNPPLTPKFTLPKGWTVSPLVTDVKADGFTFFQLNAPRLPRSAVTLMASATLPDHQIITEGFRPVGYGTLPRTNFYTLATLRIVPVDLKLPPEDKRRIAYLPGTGDDVPAALASIGLTPTILKVSDLTAAKLKAFDTVILGVRTYNAHPDLHGAPTQALFDFARNGGNVVVQYQTNEFSAADAPYPLTLDGERVIDETAPVKLLEPTTSSGGSTSRYPEPSGSSLIAHHKENTQGFSPAYALLNVPNKIISADFNNWIEERGHGFLDSWDPHYTALTETHDPGSSAEHIADQAPQRGGLITAQLGKGRWTYCAFALYRQLPEAVPGAFRLFVNLLNP